MAPGYNVTPSRKRIPPNQGKITPKISKRKLSSENNSAVDSIITSSHEDDGPASEQDPESTSEMYTENESRLHRDKQQVGECSHVQRRSTRICDHGAHSTMQNR